MSCPPRKIGWVFPRLTSSVANWSVRLVSITLEKANYEDVYYPPPSPQTAACVSVYHPQPGSTFVHKNRETPSTPSSEVGRRLTCLSVFARSRFLSSILIDFPTLACLSLHRHTRWWKVNLLQTTDLIPEGNMKEKLHGVTSRMRENEAIYDRWRVALWKKVSRNFPQRDSIPHPSRATLRPYPKATPAKTFFTVHRSSQLARIGSARKRKTKAFDELARKVDNKMAALLPRARLCV